MKLLKASLSLAITVALLWALQTKFGDIPVLGNLLNPVSGFWQNAESKNAKINDELSLPGLQGAVTIQFDERRIPHIFAGNDHDLYYAQGYITARDRLWQMDIQTRSASGRLAEVIGDKALETDRYNRRMGMVYGAENTLRGIMKDPVMKQVIEAYTDGVNVYIKSLAPKDYPIEYKLLDYKPELWKPINCAFLLKLMSQTLAGGSDQFAMTNTLNKFGASIVKDLFPDYPMFESPIIPAGTKWNFKPVAIPQPSKSFLAQTSDVNTRQKVEGIGSNNWAISGSKSASGYPILANDPHLNLSYPSIWYQAQLSAPGVNVYGVSLPGAPGIVIGYNQKISWGVTNVDASVLDWYQIKFKDAAKTEYWYNNRWNKVTRRIEVIGIRGKKPLYDTVLYTHHGPVVYESADKKTEDAPDNIPVGNALRWVAHDESDEFKTFYLLNRGSNYNDYREALKYYTAPAQNFIFADADKDIAITPNGKFPLKYKEQGKFIMDGSDPGNDWHGFIPYEQNPTVKNPAQGYLSSANQSSTDPTYPYYINWHFGGYERGKRINDRLAAMQNATVDSLRILQTDDYSIGAQDVLPTLLRYVDATKLDAPQTDALKTVSVWNKHFAANAIGATIFDLWWRKFYELTWDKAFSDKKEPLAAPSRDRTEKLLLKEPASKWFDDKQTPAIETAGDIVNKAFIAAIDQLIREHGDQGQDWEWGRIKRMSVTHLTRQAAFSSGNFISGGTGSTVNALIGGHGPSWRMVVQLGPQVKGYGILPGGESGNPGSFYYDDMLPTWKDGKLDELLYLQSADEKSSRIKSTLKLKGK
ncbi:penicillin acylase family protein [Mucilaginibacter gynuensis]|uniref:Penicillin acylase family protein n=1 Tax=Mucilaginibacter gynuensis TaxID=1302236 RepID=A0ABP8G3X4_9SPHI